MRLDKYINFDHNFYGQHHKDLVDLKDRDALLHHYTYYGYSEGRISSPLALRKYLVESISGKNILEIGAFSKPLIKGDNVKYFDIFTTNDLLKIANQDGINDYYSSQQVVKVDYSSPDGSLASIPETFDVVISAHNLEHQTDLITHLLEVEKILNDGGGYYLVIPNASYCFDASIPESTIGELLDAYLEQRKRHTLGSVVNHFACTTHNNHIRHWSEKKNPFPLINSQLVLESIKKYEDVNGGYIDVHGWRFSPYTFSAIFNTLIEINLLPYKKLIVNGPVYGTNEFTAVFLK